MSAPVAITTPIAITTPKPVFPKRSVSADQPRPNQILDGAQKILSIGKQRFSGDRHWETGEIFLWETTSPESNRCSNGMKTLPRKNFFEAIDSNPDSDSDDDEPAESVSAASQTPVDEFPLLD
jgi:hypothetical protein